MALSKPAPRTDLLSLMFGLPNSSSFLCYRSSRPAHLTLLSSVPAMLQFDFTGDEHVTSICIESPFLSCEMKENVYSWSSGIWKQVYFLKVLAWGFPSILLMTPLDSFLLVRWKANLCAATVKLFPLLVVPSKFPTSQFLTCQAVVLGSHLVGFSVNLCVVPSFCVRRSK